MLHSAIQFSLEQWHSQPPETSLLPKANEQHIPESRGLNRLHPDNAHGLFQFPGSVLLAKLQNRLEGFS